MILEKDFIVACLKDKQTLEGSVQTVRPKFIENDSYRLVYILATDHIEKYGELPKEAHVLELVKKAKVYTKVRENKLVKIKFNPDTKKTFVRATRKLLEDAEEPSQASVDILKQFAKERLLVDAIELSMEKLEEGNTEAAFSVIDRLRDADTILEKGYEIKGLIDNFEADQEERRLRKEHPERFKLLPTPWRTINSALGAESSVGGIQGGEMITIGATSGVGKSIALGNLALNGMAEGLLGGIVSIENSAWQSRQRLSSRMTMIPYEKFKGFNFTPKDLKKIRKLIKYFKKELDNDLYVIDTDPRNTNIRTIERAVREIEIRTGRKLDFLIVDYADLMKPLRKLESYRLEQREVYWDLKAFALIRGIPLATATQMKQEYAGKKGYIESLGESADKGRLLDIIMTLNQNAGQKERNELTAILAKNRDGIGGIEVPMIARYDIMHLKEAR